MKKIILLALTILAVSLVFAGCGKEEQSNSGGSIKKLEDAAGMFGQDDDQEETLPDNIDKDTEADMDADIDIDLETDDNTLSEDELTFEDLICGTYLSDADDEEERRVFDILSIDGRLYMEYVGMYEYSAAEMTLLEEKPFVKDGCYCFMVRMYPFSSFAFAGEFQGSNGQVCCIRKNPQGELEISRGAGIHDVGGYTLVPAEKGTFAHPVLSYASDNTDYQGIFGTWRRIVTTDGIDYDNFLDFRLDGTVDFVEKAEGYTPRVNRGIYYVTEEDGKTLVMIDSETVGNGDMPNDTYTFEYDEAAGTLCLADDSSSNFVKTSQCSHESAIAAGPCTRAEEVEEMWAEYQGDFYFTYDYQPEMLDEISKNAAENAGASDAYVVSIQESNNGGMAWICCYDKETDETVTYMYYEFGSGRYTDIYGNVW